MFSRLLTKLFPPKLVRPLSSFKELSKKEAEQVRGGTKWHYNGNDKLSTRVL
jgi:hypothetical protein